MLISASEYSQVSTNQRLIVFEPIASLVLSTKSISSRSGKEQVQHRRDRAISSTVSDRLFLRWTGTVLSVH